MTPPDEIARIAESLTEAQRAIVLENDAGDIFDGRRGRSISILTVAGLITYKFKIGGTFGRETQIYLTTLTPLGLAVRQYLMSKGQGGAS